MLKFVLHIFLFTDAWESRWVQSQNAGKEFGKFKLTAGKFYGDEEASKGIQTPEVGFCGVVAIPVLNLNNN